MGKIRDIYARSSPAGEWLGYIEDEFTGIKCRLAALEAAREQPPKPEPELEPEIGWVILRESSKCLRYYDRECGFVRAGGDHFHRPAIFYNKIDAERVVEDLGLRSLPFGAEGAEVVRVGCISSANDLTYYKEAGEKHGDA